MSAVLNQPVVIDNGTGIIKAGFAGADKPKVCFCSRARLGANLHYRLLQLLPQTG